MSDIRQATYSLFRRSLFTVINLVVSHCKTSVRYGAAELLDSLEGAYHGKKPRYAWRHDHHSALLPDLERSIDTTTNFTKRYSNFSLCMAIFVERGAHSGGRAACLFNQARVAKNVNGYLSCLRGGESNRRRLQQSTPDQFSSSLRIFGFCSISL